MEEKYKDEFEEKKFWDKLTHYAKAAGQKTVYTGLLLFYAFRRKDTPRWAKGIVMGALGYFISPIDGVPDLTPFLGYTDDFSVMMFALVVISAYINQEVKDQAKSKLENWFGKPDEEALAEVDKQI